MRFLIYIRVWIDGWNRWLTHGTKTNELVCNGASEIVCKLKFPKEMKEREERKGKEGERETAPLLKIYNAT